MTTVTFTDPSPAIEAAADKCMRRASAFRTKQRRAARRRKSLLAAGRTHDAFHEELHAAHYAAKAARQDSIADDLRLELDASCCALVNPDAVLPTTSELEELGL